MSELIACNPEDKVHYVFKSSTLARRSGAGLDRRAGRHIGQRAPPDIDLDAEVERIEDQLDPYLLGMLLEPLEGVKQSPTYHPEGMLYHSLQVFELAPAKSGPTTKSFSWPPCCTT